MATNQNLNLSHPSFSRRIDYVRNLLLETMKENKNSLNELDEDFEDDEYLHKGGLQTQGRKAKLENEEKERVIIILSIKR